MKKALICGVSGQDGGYLAQLLLHKDYKVYGTSRNAGPASFENLKALGIQEKIEIESISLDNFQNLFQFLEKICPDEIYNLAGQSSVGLSFEQPVATFYSIGLGTLNLLEAIRLTGRPMKLFNAGSSECFGNTEGLPANEDTPFNPRSPYAVAKAAAFWEVANYREAYGIFACSGILFNHESPLRPERFVTKKIITTACRISRGSKEKLILGNISIQRDWGWAPEYVDAMRLMLQQEEPEDFVIATGKVSKLETFLELAFSAVGLDWHHHVEHNPDLLRPADILISKGNPSKAEQKLNWKAKYDLPEIVTLLVEAEMNRSRSDKIRY